MAAALLSGRAAFETALAEVPAGTPLAVAVTDLDHFKELNDELGHEQGDLVLQSFERTLQGSLPAEAVLARTGGDEYSVAIPHSTPERALILLEEIRTHLVEQAEATASRRVDVSVGIAARPQHAQDTADLIRAADEALFRAKREGKGRVAIYVEDKMTLKSNYYPKASLVRLAKLAGATGRTEASLLREALDDLVVKYGEKL
jgi:diguanylate cyclase (GGDEF)-like protein